MSHLKNLIMNCCPRPRAVTLDFSPIQSLMTHDWLISYAKCKGVWKKFGFDHRLWRATVCQSCKWDCSNWTVHYYKYIMQIYMIWNFKIIGCRHLLYGIVFIIIFMWQTVSAKFFNLADLINMIINKECHMIWKNGARHTT